MSNGNALVVAGRSGTMALVAAMIGQAFDNDLLTRGFKDPKQISVNRYRPHQGKQEVARRRKQIAAGMLRAG